MFRWLYQGDGEDKAYYVYGDKECDLEPELGGGFNGRPRGRRINGF